MPECQTNSYCQSSLLKASHSSENSLIWHCISPFLCKIQQCCNIKIAFILKIKLQLWNMTCYCTVHGPSMEAPSNKLQVVMHHMWWSSPKSNSKIQHQKKIIFRQNIQYYGMKLTWMGSNECAEYSRGVFINNIAHIYVSTEAVWRCPFPIYSAGPTYCFRGQ